MSLPLFPVLRVDMHAPIYDENDLTSCRLWLAKRSLECSFGTLTYKLMASQQAPARPRFLLASSKPSNQVPQPRPSFMTQSTTFGQNFWFPTTAQPPPSAAVAPPPLPAKAAPPAAAPRAAVVPVITSSSSEPPLFQSRIFTTPKSPLPISHVPKLVSPSPTPSPPPSSFQASIGVSFQASLGVTILF
ncbi:hypothetical protein LguiB_021728 [Lonicera macranthoides]